MSAWLLVAVLLTYTLPDLFPDPTLAFYIARGWLGCLFAVALWRGWRISWPVALAIVVFEGSSAVCGALFAAGAPPGTSGLCDSGSGLPLTLLGVAVALAAAVAPRIDGTTKNSRGDDD